MGFTEGPPSIETLTPNLDRLVKEGVRLDRHCKFCQRDRILPACCRRTVCMLPAAAGEAAVRRQGEADPAACLAVRDMQTSTTYVPPTRTNIQSGRLPVHVTVSLSNPDVPTTGVPRNMTGMAEVLTRAEYATHYMGKWQVGRRSVLCRTEDSDDRK